MFPRMPQDGQVTITYEWRGDFENAAVGALHAEGFGPGQVSTDWRAQVHRHSLGWVCARQDGGLAGFVNVAWDGGAHAFILDTVVAASSSIPWWPPGPGAPASAPG